MCNETAGNSINADEIRNENRFLIFVFEKNKNCQPTKNPCDGREGKAESDATESKIAVVLSPRGVSCLRRAVSSGNVTPTAIRSLAVPWPRSFKEMG